MKILLATWFPSDPSTPRGGVEAVSVNLSRSLSAVHGTQVHVVSFDGGITIPSQSQWSGAIIHRLPRPRGSLLSFAHGEGSRKIRELVAELAPDVVHAHDTYGIMTRGLDVPRVFTIHGFIHEDTRLRGGWRNRVLAALWRREELSTWAEQPHVVSISPYVRERLRGIARGVIHDIENPIDPACFEIERKEDPGTILCAAVICHRKNQLGLINAVAGLPDHTPFKLRLAGSVTDSAYDDKLIRAIHDHQLEDRVELPGTRSTAEIRGELAKASIFALCSYEEGAPIGVAEAMAARVPVITSNRCGMPYMVRDGESGFLVEPDNLHQIRNRIDTLLADPALRRKMGEAARLQAAERHHPDRVAERTLRVYQEAIGR